MNEDTIALNLRRRLERLLRAVDADEAHQIHEERVFEAWHRQQQRLNNIRQRYRGAGTYKKEDT